MAQRHLRGQPWQPTHPACDVCVPSTPPAPVPPSNYLVAPEGSSQPCLAVKFATDNEFPMLGAKILEGVLVTVDNADSTVRFKLLDRCTDVLEFVR